MSIPTQKKLEVREASENNKEEERPRDIETLGT